MRQVPHTRKPSQCVRATSTQRRNASNVNLRLTAKCLEPRTRKPGPEPRTVDASSTALSPRNKSMDAAWAQSAAPRDLSSRARNLIQCETSSRAGRLAVGRWVGGRAGGRAGPGRGPGDSTHPRPDHELKPPPNHTSWFRFKDTELARKTFAFFCKIKTVELGWVSSAGWSCGTVALTWECEHEKFLTEREWSTEKPPEAQPCIHRSHHVQRTLVLMELSRKPPCKCFGCRGPI